MSLSPYIATTSHTKYFNKSYSFIWFFSWNLKYSSLLIFVSKVEIYLIFLSCFRPLFLEPNINYFLLFFFLSNCSASLIYSFSAILSILSSIVPKVYCIFVFDFYSPAVSKALYYLFCASIFLLYSAILSLLHCS